MEYYTVPLRQSTNDPALFLKSSHPNNYISKKHTVIPLTNKTVVTKSSATVLLSNVYMEQNRWLMRIFIISKHQLGKNLLEWGKHSEYIFSVKKYNIKFIFLLSQKFLKSTLVWDSLAKFCKPANNFNLKSTILST